MAQVLIREENGTEKVIGSYEGTNIIAVKVYTDELIRSQLESDDIKPTDENVSAVIDGEDKILKFLTDINEADWEIIKRAVRRMF